MGRAVACHGPAALEESHERRPAGGVLVYVDDVASHCERAKQAGAHILSEPEGGFPGPRYRVEDVEGHRWMFVERAGK